MSASILCPHCGEPDWSRAPRLRMVLTFVEQRKAVTSRDVAEHFGLTIQNASNATSSLAQLGYLTRESAPNPSGGIFNTFRLAALHGRTP